MIKFNDVLKLLTSGDLNRIKYYFILGMCQLLVVVFALWCYDSFCKQKIGVVNITGIADEFIKTQSRSNISSEELKKRVRLFGFSLEKGLQEIGARKRVILMPAEAVITGAKDYTQEIQNYLSKIIPKASLKAEPQQVQPLTQTGADLVSPEQQQIKKEINEIIAPMVVPPSSLQETPTITIPTNPDGVPTGISSTAL